MPPQREWFEKDYYKALGVPEGASQKELTKAYRKLARQHHPDTNQGDAKAEERFKEISAAYDVLGDAEKRKEYDEVRRLGPMASGFGGGGPSAGGGPQGFTYMGDSADINDLLGGLFGRVRRGGRGGPGGGVGPQRGEDLEAGLTLAFEDAAQGLTTSLYLTSDAACSTCSGTGARPGTHATVCPVCNGRGVLDDNQGLFSLSSPCRNCGGLGHVIEDPCPTCRGTGVERREREVKVRIPSGIDDGQRIRLKGRGGPGRNGGPPGDLYVTAKVMPHKIFGRKGLDLTLRVPVTYPEAALGAQVEVPTLDGGPVKLKINPSVPLSKPRRVKGKGVSNGKSTGDLLVTFEVAVPARLSAGERKAIEELAKASDESPRAHLEV
jgi:molecular chaperone DnaJ